MQWFVAKNGMLPDNMRYLARLMISDGLPKRQYRVRASSRDE